WRARSQPPRDAELKAQLMAGFAQLDALQLPAHAALPATVEACRALGRPRQAGMVNAVLRRAQREGFPAVADDAGWPAWQRQQLRADWGDQAEANIAERARMAPMWLRVPRARGSPAENVARLVGQGSTAHTGPGLAGAERPGTAEPGSPPPGLAHGGVSGQGGSAQQGVGAQG
ncbi:transcription antitermination factor NusB, partial [Xanthomonas campestris]|uniref:transcription antitermination factor NusB n=1 Tax=Xanthomonas campestris TaxID=339 RepID=UPI00403A30C5